MRVLHSWLRELTPIGDPSEPGVVEALADTMSALGLAVEEVVRAGEPIDGVVVAKVLAGRGYDAIVALGVVIRGGTPHFEYVSQGVTLGLTQVTVDTGVPVGFGVLTCDTEEQALDRAGLEGSNEDKGHEAVTAAVASGVAKAARSVPAENVRSPAAVSTTQRTASSAPRAANAAPSARNAGSSIAPSGLR